jgi:peptidyl-prolyl cis-trans isomerase A (cyclophilin A)/peptidyl-prolyl cis-trans isomerase B (cyclophilin B)
MKTLPSPRAALAAAAAALLLAACGGGDGGSANDPTVSSATAESARYGQTVLITVNGSNLDNGLSVTSSGCTGMTLQTSAPNISSPTTAYYRCTVSATGTVPVTIQRTGSSFVLQTLNLSVPVPQVTLSFSNGAGVNGSLVITLTPTQTPITVNNFLAYVRAGFYDGTVIHRHSPNFVLQGGGYAGPLAVGSGTAPTIKTPIASNITLEDNAGLSNVRLTVAMARTSDPNSANSQFFINLANNTFLDRTPTARGYAVFGTVTSGEAVVNSMVGAPCVFWSLLVGNGECVPSPNITITSATQTR